MSILKLDRSFTQGMQQYPADPVDLKIVEGIVSLAHSLDLAVTVEGVETGAQAEQLRDTGLRHGPGLVLRPPGPPGPPARAGAGGRDGLSAAVLECCAGEPVWGCGCAARSQSRAPKAGLRPWHFASSGAGNCALSHDAPAPNTRRRPDRAGARELRDQHPRTAPPNSPHPAPRYAPPAEPHRSSSIR